MWITEERYEYWGAQGKTWTPWFRAMDHEEGEIVVNKLRIQFRKADRDVKETVYLPLIDNTRTLEQKVRHYFEVYPKYAYLLSYKTVKKTLVRELMHVIPEFHSSTLEDLDKVWTNQPMHQLNKYITLQSLV